MKRAKGGRGKSVEITISIWWDEKQGHIHIRGERTGPLLISTVSPDPQSDRGNPNLFYKLAAYLRKSGAPAPPPQPQAVKRASAVQVTR